MVQKIRILRRPSGNFEAIRNRRGALFCHVWYSYSLAISLCPFGCPLSTVGPLYSHPYTMLPPTIVVSGFNSASSRGEAV